MRGIFFAVFSFLITVLLLPALIVTSCDLSISQKDKLKEENIIESDLKIKVYNHKTREIMELYLEEYVMHVVAAEVPAAFELEALKAQAVAARTYAVWRLSNYGEKGHPEHPGAITCTSHQHCQEYLTKDELRERHGRLWMYRYWPKIEEAVDSTAGIVMTYNMKPIEPLYHSTSGGKTENAEDVFANAVPYLRSVSSPYEERSPVLVDHMEIDVNSFLKTFKNKYNDFTINEKDIKSQIKIIERSTGGSIKRIKIGNKELTGREVREIFQLRSADFSIDVRGNEIEFTTKGYGHGVGMSQWGANGMAERGSTYEEILKHYYQGITLSRIKKYR